MGTLTWPGLTPLARSLVWQWGWVPLVPRASGLCGQQWPLFPGHSLCQVLGGVPSSLDSRSPSSL